MGNASMSGTVWTFAKDYGSLANSTIGWTYKESNNALQQMVYFKWMLTAADDSYAFNGQHFGISQRQEEVPLVCFK